MDAAIPTAGLEERASALLACSEGRPVIQIALDPVSGATTVSSVGVDEAEIPGFLGRVATALAEAARTAEDADA